MKIYVVLLLLWSGFSCSSLRNLTYTTCKPEEDVIMMPKRFFCQMECASPAAKPDEIIFDNPQFMQCITADESGKTVIRPLTIVITERDMTDRIDQITCDCKKLNNFYLNKRVGF